MAFNVLEGMAYAQQQGEMGRARGQENKLASLAQQAYGAQGQERTSLLGQMAGVNPQGLVQAGQFEEQGDKRGKRMAGAAKYMLSAIERGDPAAIEGAYRTIMPEFEPFAREAGKPLPQSFDPAMTPILHQIIAAAGGTEAAGNNVQSTYINAQGQRVAIMRDGSQQVLGNANQSIRVLEQEGALPYGVVTSGGVAGQVVPLGASGQQQAPMQQQMAPGEVPYAIDPSLPPQVQASIRADQGQWANASESNPVNIPQQPQSFGGGMGGPVRTPTAGEKAAAEAAAKAQVELGYAPAQAAADADRARLVKLAEADAAASAREAYGSDESRTAAREAQTKKPQLQEVVRLTGRIASAVKGLEGGLIDTGPVDQYAQRFTEAGQTLQSDVGAIQNSMLALTRVPGVGSQSDLEARAAALKFPQLGLHPNVNARRVEDLNAFVKDLETAYANVTSGGANQSRAPIPVRSAADYEAVPSGAEYMAPDGSVRRKK